MTDKDKEVRTDGRTDKEIRLIAISGDISTLTNNQYDRYVNKIKDTVYNKKKNGGMIKGYSPIARPQRFKGIF